MSSETTPGGEGRQGHPRRGVSAKKFLDIRKVREGKSKSAKGTGKAGIVFTGQKEDTGQWTAGTDEACKLGECSSVDT